MFFTVNNFLTMFFNLKTKSLSCLTSLCRRIKGSSEVSHGGLWRVKSEGEKVRREGVTNIIIKHCVNSSNHFI